MDFSSLKRKQRITEKDLVDKCQRLKLPIRHLDALKNNLKFLRK